MISSSWHVIQRWTVSVQASSQAVSMHTHENEDLVLVNAVTALCQIRLLLAACINAAIVMGFLRLSGRGAVSTVVKPEWTILFMYDGRDGAGVSHGMSPSLNTYNCLVTSRKERFGGGFEAWKMYLTWPYTFCSCEMHHICWIKSNTC